MTKGRQQYRIGKTAFCGARGQRERSRIESSHADKTPLQGVSSHARPLAASLDLGPPFQNISDEPHTTQRSMVSHGVAKPGLPATFALHWPAN